MIKTKRLLIKQLNSNDAGQVTRLLADPVLVARAGLTFSTQPVNRLEIGLLLKSARFWGIFSRRQAQKLLGLLMIDDTAHGLPANQELGYLLRRANWNQGLMTEAVAGLVGTLEEPLSAITAQDNVASQLVLSRNDFKRVATADEKIIWCWPACTSLKR